MVCSAFPNSVDHFLRDAVGVFLRLHKSRRNRAD
jgi:hypothetical protein